MKKLLILLISFLFFVSCEKKIIQISYLSLDSLNFSLKTSNNAIQKLKISSSFFDLLDLISKIEIKTISELDRIRFLKISVKDSVIVAASRESKFFIFDFKGKLIGVIDNFGSGPKKYKILNQIYLYNSRIYIAANYFKKIQEYDFSGNLVIERKIRGYLDLPDERLSIEHAFIVENKIILICYLLLDNIVSKHYVLAYDNYKDLISYTEINVCETENFVQPSPILIDSFIFFCFAVDNKIYAIDAKDGKTYNFYNLPYDNCHIIKEIFSYPDIEQKANKLNYYNTTVGELKLIENLFVLDNVLFVYASNDIFAVYEKDGKYYCRKNLLKFDPIKASAEDYNILELVHDKDFLEKHGIDEWAQFFPQDDCIAYVDYASSNDGGNKIIISIFGIK